MRTWLRAHHIAGAFLTLTVTAGVVAVAGDVLVPVPSLARADLAGVPLGLIVPLAASAALVRGSYAGPADLEAVAARPLRLYRAGVIVAACAVPLLAGLLLTEAAPYGTAAVRNLTGFTGLASVTALWRRDLATAVPAVYMIAAMLLGGSSGPGSVWDWAVVTPDHPLTWALPIASLTLGLTVPEGRLLSLRGSHATAGRRIRGRPGS